MGQQGCDLCQHCGPRTLDNEGPVLEGPEVGAPRGNVAGIVDQEKNSQTLVPELCHYPVQILATGQVEPLVGIFQHQKGDTPGDLLQQAQFAGLAGAQLAVAPIQQTGQGKEVDQVMVALNIGEKITGRGAGIDPVEKVGVILAQFSLENRLLPLEREQAEVRRQLQAFGSNLGCFAGKDIAEPFYAGSVAADQAPGLAGQGGKMVDPQPLGGKMFDDNHGRRGTGFTRPTAV